MSKLVFLVNVLSVTLLSFGLYQIYKNRIEINRWDMHVDPDSIWLRKENQNISAIYSMNKFFGAVESVSDNGELINLKLKQIPRINDTESNNLVTFSVDVSANYFENAKLVRTSIENGFISEDLNSIEYSNLSSVINIGDTVEIELWTDTSNGKVYTKNIIVENL
jgi:hypothetical protein